MCRGGSKHKVGCVAERLITKAHGKCACWLAHILDICTRWSWVLHPCAEGPQRRLCGTQNWCVPSGYDNFCVCYDANSRDSYCTFDWDIRTLLMLCKELLDSLIKTERSLRIRDWFAPVKPQWTLEWQTSASTNFVIFILCIFGVCKWSESTFNVQSLLVPRTYKMLVMTIK